MGYIDTKGNKEVLVLLHGLGSKKESWKHQLALAKHFRLIMPDLRGHGESEINSNISMATFAGDVLALLDSLGIEEAHFCGLSLGGMVVQEIMKQRPEIVKSAVLANTVSSIPFLAGMGAGTISSQLLMSVSDETFTERSIRMCIYDKDNEDLVREMKEIFFNINRSTYFSASTASAGVNYTKTLQEFERPILIITSLNDELTPYHTSIAIQKAANSAKMLVLDKCGHASNVEKAEDFNRAILSFIKGV